MTPSMLKTLLKTYLVLLVDHREQDREIENGFRFLGAGDIQPRLNAIRLPLEAGDFSFMLLPNEKMELSNPVMFNDRFIIERKSGKQSQGGGFAEMRNNLFKGHEQFKKEFQFPAEYFFLLLENTQNENDIFNCQERCHSRITKHGEYRSYSISNEQYYKTYRTFIEHRNQEREEKGLPPIKIIHCEKKDSTNTIKQLIFNYVLNLQKKE